MKKSCILLVVNLLLSAVSFGQQVPKGMNYQAVARNSTGEIINNKAIGLKISLFDLQHERRTDHYTEIHEVKTNELGLFNLVIGEGVKQLGEYGLVPWNEENIWMEVSIRDKGQGGFSTISSSKLMAVPYAIHAVTANRLSENKQISTSSFAPPEPGVISTSWSVFGNAKTDASGNIFRTNSLGTTDFVDLIMITDNVERLRMLATGDIRTKLNFEIGQNLNIGQNMYVALSACIGDSLIAQKNVFFNTVDGSTINYGPFTVADLSPTLLTGTLTVDKATDFNTTLNVARATNMNGRLTVTKMAPTLLTGTLVVDSVTNLNDALNVNAMSPTLLTGTLQVNKDATFNEKVKILSMHQTDTAGPPPSGSLQVGGGAFIQKNLYIGGVAKFGGPVGFGAMVSITDLTQSTDPSTGALKVSGGVGIGLNLNVGGAAMIGGMMTVKDSTQSFNDSTGALKVFGGVGIVKRLNVGGAAAFGSTLNVKGITSLTSTLNVINGSNFIAQFVNKANQNGISIQVNNPTPGHANNYMEFRNGSSGVVGRIEGENASEYMLNPSFVNELANYNSAILQAQLKVAIASVDLAMALAGVVASASSTTVCIGFGACFTNPIISLIVVAALKAGLMVGGVVASAIGLNTANNNKDAWLAYKAARIGVTYESGSGDYAEWLKKADPEETFIPGQIVGLKNGKITKHTEGADKFLVISTKPIVLGNMPNPGLENEYEKVAFMGQVPIFVLGKVDAGDYILPSGRSDGIGRAIAPHLMRAGDYGKIVGVAWSSESANAYNLVHAAIGLNARDIGKPVVEQEKLLQELEMEFNQSNKMLARVLHGYKEAAKAAGILEKDFSEVADPTCHPNTVDAGMPSSAGSIGFHALFEMSEAQVLEILNMAQSSFVNQGGEMSNNEFFNRLNNEPGYKKQFVRDVQDIYRNEIQNQLEKLRPRQ